MTDHPCTPAVEGDAQSLAQALGPALVEACGGRLSEIRWFKADWQRGGAATGLARWSTGGGREVEAMVKLPVGPVEHSWTLRLGAVEPEEWESATDLPTPRVLAAGEVLGGYDLAWLVLERLEGQTLSSDLCKRSVKDLLAAAAGFYARAERIQRPQGGGPAVDWNEHLERSREAVRDGGLPEAQRWNGAIKRVQKLLPGIGQRWENRPIRTWCHGDLHPGNAMRRGSACVLIDLALVHAGCWVEDAVYLERLFWGDPDRLDGVKPVSELARQCRRVGVDTDFDYSGLANVRRALMAACAPLHAVRDGHPAYLRAALERLEGLGPQLQ